jgi:hypothetical protein
MSTNTIKSRRREDMPVTEAVLSKAIERGRQRKDVGIHATGLRYLPAPKAFMVSFADASAVAFPVRNYPELSALTGAQLKRMALGMGGSALCLEEADLHVSIVGLIAASGPLRQMAVTVAAARNGGRTSEAKAVSSRENGMKGGRPRKQQRTA